MKPYKVILQMKDNTANIVLFFNLEKYISTPILMYYVDVSLMKSVLSLPTGVASSCNYYTHQFAYSSALGW